MGIDDQLGQPLLSTQSEVIPMRCDRVHADGRIPNQGSTSSRKTICQHSYKGIDKSVGNETHSFELTIQFSSNPLCKGGFSHCGELLGPIGCNRDDN